MIRQSSASATGHPMHVDFATAASSPLPSSPSSPLASSPPSPSPSPPPPLHRARSISEAAATERQSLVLARRAGGNGGGSGGGGGSRVAGSGVRGATSSRVERSRPGRFRRNGAAARDDNEARGRRANNNNNNNSNNNNQRRRELNRGRERRARRNSNNSSSSPPTSRAGLARIGPAQHVVIVGAGLAGVSVATMLARRLGKRTATRITLVDPRNYVEVRWAIIRALFDPSVAASATIPLHETSPSSSATSPSPISSSSSSSFSSSSSPPSKADDGSEESKNNGKSSSSSTSGGGGGIEAYHPIIVHMRSRAVGFSPRAITLEDGSVLPFTVCLLATGCQPTHPVLGPSYAAADFAARRRQLAREGARLRKAAAGVLIVGGGPVGAELAGHLAAKARDEGRAPRVTLVHDRERLAEPLGARAAERLAEQLGMLGVDVILGEAAERRPREHDGEYARAQQQTQRRQRHQRGAEEDGEGGVHMEGGSGGDEEEGDDDVIVDERSDGDAAHELERSADTEPMNDEDDDEEDDDEEEGEEGDEAGGNRSGDRKRDMEGDDFMWVVKSTGRELTGGTVVVATGVRPTAGGAGDLLRGVRGFDELVDERGWVRTDRFGRVNGRVFAMGSCTAQPFKSGVTVLGNRKNMAHNIRVALDAPFIGNSSSHSRPTPHSRRGDDDLERRMKEISKPTTTSMTVLAGPAAGVVQTRLFTDGTVLPRLRSRVSLSLSRARADLGL